MKFIDPHVELIDEPNQLKKIEIAGRTCYKSEAAITEDSAAKFVRALAKHKHYAMLEHATFCFQLKPERLDRQGDLALYIIYLQSFKYFNVSYVPKLQAYVVSCNARAILDRGDIDPITVAAHAEYPDIFSDEFMSSAEEKYLDVATAVPVKLDSSNADVYSIRKHTYVTMRVTCDRGVTHEIVRHRPFSFAQESTRYCNYSKDQFGNELTFITPSTYDSWSLDKQNAFRKVCKEAEDQYLFMVSDEPSLSPQQARAVLPNALKTEIVITGSMEWWDHFFDLRYFGITGAPHPDMLQVATLAYKEYVGINVDVFKIEAEQWRNFNKKKP